MKDGDLWENFAEAVKQRGPFSVWTTKVKGPSTQEMVDEGKVAEEENTGNDESDKAAGMGSRNSQGRIAKFADLYSWRHTQYRKFMARMQKFIVGLKKEDKRLREDDEKKDDPFEKKEKKKVVMERMLEYADEGEDTFNIKMEKIQGCWEESEEEGKRTGKVQSFLERVE